MQQEAIARILVQLSSGGFTVTNSVTITPTSPPTSPPASPPPPPRTESFPPRAQEFLETREIHPVENKRDRYFFTEEEAREIKERLARKKCERLSSKEVNELTRALFPGIPQASKGWLVARERVKRKASKFVSNIEKKYRQHCNSNSRRNPKAMKEFSDWKFSLGSERLLSL